jgi:lactate dehydrogenase-like 2-hydroxyacid dehydrogenase
MSNSDFEVLLVGPPRPTVVNGLASFTVHQLWEAKDRAALLHTIAPRVRAIASVASSEAIGGPLMGKLPRLEIVASFGVGYDHVDANWAGAHGIVVTNTPDVLTEEVADTALGLLMCTVREFPQAERYLRAGRWREKAYPLTRATLRNRTVGLVGMGRIGQAIARRLDAMLVPVVYHSRRPVPGVPYRHYPKLRDMARDSTILVVIVPGGEETRNIIDAEVLAALGPEGILINMARGSVVDEQALIRALQDKTIMAAGLDVYAREPDVPAELIAMENVVLFPHLGSASIHTRTMMDQLVVDNLVAWAAGKPPLTPVPETPFPPSRSRGSAAAQAGATVRP